MAFKSREYIYMAAHLAASIKCNDPDLLIQIVHDENIGYLPNAYRSVFDHLTPIEKSHLYVDGKFEPGLAKLKAYDYSLFERTIYLDVDGLCLNSLEDVFEKCDSFYKTEVIGKGGLNDKIGYSIWATNENIWKHFELSQESIFPAVQSSFQYFEKGDQGRKLYDLFSENFSYPKDKLKNHWGGSTPDELIISGSCAQMNHDPSIDMSVVYFGNSGNKKPISEVTKDYKILSLYGNGKGATLVSSNYIDLYDRAAIRRFKQLKLRPIKKAFQLMKAKHVN